ncbi:KR-domain-containing protein [Mytilinidion resinicola]|uniref:KR-domain-containing protein n=1 Tax=Mytilinidion resinicola TaxID=574789 RepID=A0A6A6Y384_9PEZI|nr:KR-domain-containing protein [Mytilinidion resinicola]KAF2802983.1 KR-domain-containing protein [Mytilinidion resinicola]
MGPFARNSTFASIDLNSMMRQRPEEMSRLLQKVADMVQKGQIRPLDTTIYGVNQIEDALRLLPSGQSMGKVVVKVEKGVTVEPFAEVATHAIAGGLGGLGRSIARWMAKRGARHMLLLSRSGGEQPEAAQFIRDMTSQGL